jgi:nicotinamide-nucleotide amidase
VVYREATKRQWLGVDAALLRRHGAESPEASAAIARNVLLRTDEADLSLGMTGHLGPSAPLELDGHVFLSVWGREDPQPLERAQRHIQLTAAGRSQRQREAVDQALRLLQDVLRDAGDA